MKSRMIVFSRLRILSVIVKMHVFIGEYGGDNEFPVTYLTDIVFLSVVGFITQKFSTFFVHNLL